MGRPKYQRRYSDDELKAIADRQLDRIRRGEPMLTVMYLPIRDRVKVERQWKEGGGAPYRLRDVAI
jgi:hypothetical protein